MRSDRRLISLLLLALCWPGALAQASEPALELDDLRAFSEAWRQIKSHYVEPIDDKTLLEAALRGMTAELDPHSDWLSADQLERLEEQALGRYGGLGIRLAIQPDYLQIVATEPAAPGHRAGLRPGDRIVAVNAQRIVQDNAETMAASLRGPPGSLVELLIERPGRSEPEQLAVAREVITRASLELEVLAGGRALLTIDSFQQNTVSELDLALRELATLPALSALILDLRGNPGGIVQAAVAAADRFLDEGLIVLADARNPADSLRYEARPGQLFGTLPVAILINSGTASAAEIMAAALADHGRARLFGETSWGKGSVQTIWPLSNGSGLRLTTAYYRTPAGRQIEGAGLVPHEAVEDRPDPQNQSDPVLERALEWLEAIEPQP